MEKAQLDAVQLHGDEPPEFLAELAEMPLIRAFRCKTVGVEPIRDYLQQCRRLPDAILLDAAAPGMYGGSGKKLDWNDVRATLIHAYRQVAGKKLQAQLSDP